MSAVMTPPAPPSAPAPRPSISKSSAGGWRSAKSAIASFLIVMSLVVAIVPLVLIVGYVIVRGIDSISWAFLTDDIPILTRSDGPGMGPAVVGTLLITGAATVMAVPLGILGGIYLNEYSARSASGRGDDRSALDRHGPLHLLDLGVAVRGLRLRGGAGARVPHASRDHPHDGGDAQARRSG